jgi:membrane protein required for colicin V production
MKTLFARPPTFATVPSLKKATDHFLPLGGRGFKVQGYDLIMLIVLGMATIFGAIKGFAWQVASLASIIVSYFVAYRFRYDVAEMIQAQPPWNQFLAMLILYVGTSFVIWVGFRLISGTIDRVRLKEFDRHLGAAFGLAKGCVFCLLITMFATSLLGPKQQAAICQSRSGYYIAKVLNHGVGVLPKEINDVVGPYLARLDEKLKNGGALEDSSSLTADNPNGLWPSGGIPGLENIPESFQNGLRDALPQMLPNGLGTGSNNLAPTPSTAPANWNLGNGFPNGGLPSFDPANFNSSNLAPSSILPPSGAVGVGTAPQSYPPLGQGSAPWPNAAAGVPPLSSGLRPAGSAVGSPTMPPQTAQPGWGSVLPR